MAPDALAASSLHLSISSPAALILAGTSSLWTIAVYNLQHKAWNFPQELRLLLLPRLMAISKLHALKRRKRKTLNLRGNVSSERPNHTQQSGNRSVKHRGAAGGSGGGRWREGEEGGVPDVNRTQNAERSSHVGARRDSSFLSPPYWSLKYSL